MPKKPIFTKEQVYKTAFEVFKIEGIDGISARNLAKSLGASPAPIYSFYSSIDTLKNELLDEAKKLFLDYVKKERTDSIFSVRILSAKQNTVVNFWFTTCSPCVGELADLEALNKQLAEKGGAVVGINSFTLDGDETAISDAKDILSKKGVSYKNIWFDSKSEAGKFTSGLYSYPTTYVVDKNGNIVGEPIVGAITAKKQAEMLQKLIDQNRR